MANKQDLIAKVAEATELTKKDSAAAGHNLYICHPRPGGGPHDVGYRRRAQPGLYSADRNSR